MPYVAFQKNDCTVINDSTANFENILDFLINNAAFKIQISGHRGADEKTEISLLRAKAVLNYFIDLNLPAERMVLQELGLMKHPLNENNKLQDQDHPHRGPAMKKNWVVSFTILN